jgi:hypothetical protein
MKVLNFLSVPNKTINNKRVSKKAEFFFHNNAVANLSSGGTDILFLVSGNLTFGPDKTSSL